MKLTFLPATLGLFVLNVKAIGLQRLIKAVVVEKSCEVAAPCLAYYTPQIMITAQIGHI